MPRGQAAVLAHVEGDPMQDPLCRRLAELGFCEGATVTLLHTGPFGGNPLAVQVGSSLVALRRAEAARIWVRPQ
jgi:ferrous iron transport protein A